MAFVDDRFVVPPAAASRRPMPRWALLLLAILAEVVLAYWMQFFPILALPHLAALVAGGLYAISRRNLEVLTCICGYLVGSEVLWRQSKAPVYYLAAPYLLIIFSVIAIVVVFGTIGRDGRLSMLYIALLAPAVITTIRVAGGGSRELIVFSLSGPAALAAFVAYSSQIRATFSAYRNVLWAVVISAVGPLVVALTSISNQLANAGSIRFNDQSNIVTSGGFGPVQVSAVLGLGVLVAILLTIAEREQIYRIIAGVMAVVFAVQSLLTFSRGGMSATAIAVGALAIAQAKNPRVRNRIIAVVVVALTLGYFIVIPWLVDFTGGEFEERFGSAKSSRTELAANDYEIFQKNMAFGIGPGMTKYERLTFEICEIRSDGCKDEASSHTEFTRLLGEHGLPGIAAMVVLVILAVRALRRSFEEQPFAVAFLAWAIAQMFYANLRVAAVPFAFGIAFLTIFHDKPPPDESDEHAAVGDNAVPAWADLGRTGAVPPPERGW